MVRSGIESPTVQVSLHRPSGSRPISAALETAPNLTIHYGHLLAKTKQRPLARQPQSGPATADDSDQEGGLTINPLSVASLLAGCTRSCGVGVLVSLTP